MAPRRHRVIVLVLTLAASSILSGQPGHAGPSVPPPVLGEMDRQGHAFSQDSDAIIVTVKNAGADAVVVARDAVERAAGPSAAVLAVTAITTDTVSVRLDRTLDPEESADLAALVEDAAGIAAADPSATFTPATKDTYYGFLWNLNGSLDSGFGVDAAGAWAYTTGSGEVIGVVDTGITAHKDLTGSATRTWGGNVVKGYDFVSDRAAAGDGSGWDANPADPGDYCAGYWQSSWHGTHVAGTAVAVGGNKRGVVGVAPKAKVQALRAMGRCGGSEADIVAAIRWGAGLPIVGVPANRKPATVLNLSLGATETSCSTAMQAAIDDVVAAGVAVVVSAGNDALAVSSSSPANCDNVVRVAATTFDGQLADYSNVGTAELAVISAPGGAGASDVDPTDWIISTSNAGTRTSRSGTYVGMAGTSMAAPHVAATIALLRSIDDSLDPAELREILNDTATPLPACSLTDCGPGVVDAAAAVRQVAGNALADLGDAEVSGTLVQGGRLSAGLSTEPAQGLVLTYRWFRNGQPIVGATSPVRTLTAADLDQAVSVRVTATIGPLSAVRESEAVHPVLLPFVAAAQPSVSGTHTVGRTLTARPGTWAPAPAKVRYQWLRNGTAIKGATSSRYVLAKADRTASVAVRVTVTRTGYLTASADTMAVPVA